MKQIYIILLLSIAILIPVSAYAQNIGNIPNCGPGTVWDAASNSCILEQPIQKSITVQTDKASYTKGEIILITGEVRDLYSGTPISVIVIAPNGNLAALQQVQVNADKKFSTSLEAGNRLMDASGTYTVKVQYGTESRSATTDFYYDPKCGPGKTFDNDTNSCVVESQKSNNWEFHGVSSTEIKNPTHIMLTSDLTYNGEVEWCIIGVNKLVESHTTGLTDEQKEKYLGLWVSVSPYNFFECDSDPTINVGIIPNERTSFKIVLYDDPTVRTEFMIYNHTFAFELEEEDHGTVAPIRCVDDAYIEDCVPWIPSIG